MKLKILMIIMGLVVFGIIAYAAGEPVISDPLPIGLQSCTEYPLPITLQITTDENATCKYNGSDTTYALMIYTFSTTGATTHQQPLNLSCGGLYIWYTRCTDGVDTNTTSTEINFSIGAESGGSTYEPTTLGVSIEGGEIGN